MYKPPLSTFSKVGRDPTQPPGTRVAAQPQANGTKVYDCPIIPKKGSKPVETSPTLKLIDHRKVRLEGRNVDRAKDIVNTPKATMSDIAMPDNKLFQKELEESKTHEFWVFPEECNGVFVDKRNGLAYRNVCIIGINGKQWPLFPGNNRAPGIVYEALETKRELDKRFKSKLAPPKSSGRSVNMSDPNSVMKAGGVQTNQNLFRDNMMGNINVYDSSINSQATQLIRQHREKALKNKQ